jgi:dihydrofolate synthase/folylpolyglutamate synthase
VAARLLPARWKLDAVALSRGLQDVNWPGRWQRLEMGDRHVILDASHNPEGALMLDANLRRLIALTGQKPVIVMGVLGEFRARSLLEIVVRYAREIHVVTPQQARATPYADIVALTPPAARPLLREATLTQIFPDASNCAVGAPGETVVVTGSIYLLGEILERLEPKRGTGEGKLQDF